MRNVQRGTIIDIAREAYALWPGRAEHEKAATVGLDGFTAWRHAEQLKVVGKQTLTRCSEEDYEPLLMHFLRLRAQHRAESQNLSLNLNP